MPVITIHLIKQDVFVKWGRSQGQGQLVVKADIEIKVLNWRNMHNKYGHYTELHASFKFMVKQTDREMDRPKAKCP